MEARRGALGGLVHNAADMSERATRVLRALFVVYVAATAAHLAYVVSREPFAFDAWNLAIDTGAEPFSLGRFFAFWRDQYLSSNPRVGQPLAYLAYKLHGVAEVGTPLAFFALVGATFVIGAGRLPSWRRNADLAALAIGIGFLWFAAPEVGAYLFCRAYSTNYVWAAAIQLWFVAVVRLHLAQLEAPGAAPRSAGQHVWQMARLSLFGLVAGACNEHTGPTLVLFLLGGIWWVRRRRGAWPRGLVAASAGVIVGFAFLFFAPGQGQRYDGLAQRASLTDRLLSRGLSNNLDIFDDLLMAAAPLLLLTLVAFLLGELVERRVAASPGQSGERPAEPAPDAARHLALRVLALALVAGVLMTVTMFVSPKLGTRFFLHSMLLLMAAFFGVLTTFVQRPRHIAGFLVLALFASAYAAGRTIPLYTRLAWASEARLAALAAAPRGSVHTAIGWEQVPRSWWFLGDDFRDQKKRELVAKYFDLRALVFRGIDQNAPLWVTDVRLYPVYAFDRPLCLDAQPEVAVGPYQGRDVPTVQAAFRESIAEIQSAGLGTLEQMDLAVKFAGEAPPLPPGRLLVARWRAGRFEEPRARLTRDGRSRRRTVVPGPALAAKGPLQVYAVAVGDAPRLLGELPAPSPAPPLAAPPEGRELPSPSSAADKLSFAPWRSGAYWVLACSSSECWIVVSTYLWG